MANGTEERVTGALDSLSGINVGVGGKFVESLKGNAGSQNVFRAGHGPKPFVRRGDIFLPVAFFGAAVGAGDLDGEEAGPGAGERARVQLVEEFGDPVVDVFAPVVGVEGSRSEGKGNEKGFEDRDEGLPGDARHGAKVLELRDFVDDVDETDALFIFPAAEVNGVDAQEAGIAAGLRIAAGLTRARGAWTCG